MTRDELNKTVVDFLDSFTTMTLACCSDGEPWTAAVFYARQGMDFIFFSSPKSRHSRAFAGNLRAAAAVHGDYRAWRDIKGLQMEGVVERISGAASIAKATAVYLKRYPFVSQFFSDPGGISSGLADKVAKVSLYRFRTHSVRYLTNEEQFGRRWRMEYHEGEPIGDPVED